MTQNATIAPFFGLLRSLIAYIPYFQSCICGRNLEISGFKPLGIFKVNVIIRHTTIQKNFLYSLHLQIICTSTFKFAQPPLFALII